MKRTIRLFTVALLLLASFQTNANAGIFGRRASKRAELIVTGNSAPKSKLQAGRQESRILEQNEEGITFTVDNDLPLPKNQVYRMDGDNVISMILSDRGIERENFNLISSSFSGEMISGNSRSNSFFKGMIRAFSDHCPVVLTPDAVWLLVCQGFAHHVNDAPEAMRSLFVDHEGKLALVVESEFDLISCPDSVDWNGLLQGFSDQIRDNTKDGIADLVLADFSTTGPVERIVSEATLMESMKAYFEYIVLYASCGIPSITLKGTAADWEKVLEKTRALSKYGLDWWIKDLEPILEQFVAARKGQVDVEFWQDIVKTYHPDDVRGGGCSLEKPTDFDGWFLKLLPFDEKGRTPSKVTVNHKMAPEITRTPFIYVVTDVFGNVIAQFDMELCAGIIAMDQDPETYAMTPKLGWFVRIATPQEALPKD